MKKSYGIFLSAMIVLVSLSGLALLSLSMDEDHIIVPTLMVMPQDTSIDLQAPIPEQIIVRFATQIEANEQAAYLEQIGGIVVREIPALQAVVIQSPSALPPSDLILEQEPNFYVTVLTSNDPHYGDQWALEAIQAPQAWASLPDNAPIITVATIDTGVCADHPDLVGRIVSGHDFVDDDETPTDLHGHGCAVAGIIAANANNAIGIAGVAPNTQIMPIRVVDENGYGTYADVAAGIVYAADQGADIINLSIGGVHESNLIKEAIDYALSEGVMVMAAAGNLGQDALFFPAAYEPVIAIGSVDASLEQSVFSNRTADGLAPGEDILTLTLDGGYGYQTGTSFAVPHAVGVVALARGHQQELVIDGSLIAFAPPLEEIALVEVVPTEATPTAAVSATEEIPTETTPTEATPTEATPSEATPSAVAPTESTPVETIPTVATEASPKPPTAETVIKDDTPEPINATEVFSTLPTTAAPTEATPTETASPVATENSPLLSNVELQSLSLGALCVDDPTTTRRWQINNPNPETVDVTWETDAGESDNVLVAPGITILTTGVADQLTIYWADEQVSLMGSFSSCLGSLAVTHVVEWGGSSPDPSQAFSVCITGASYPNGDCKPVDYDGEVLTWPNLQAGSYTVSASDTGSDWLLWGGGVVPVTNGQRATTTTYSSLVLAEGCSDPNPRRDLYAIITPDGNNPNRRLGYVTNISEHCEYEVGMAAYQKFESTPSSQVLFSSQPTNLQGDGSTIVEPQSTIQLSVETPNCAAQVDVFFDARYLDPTYEDIPLVLPAFDTLTYGEAGKRYGSRLLAADHINGTQWCNTGELVCEIGTMSINGANEGAMLTAPTVFEALFDGTVEPTRVNFVLTDNQGNTLIHTERRSPYHFLGDTNGIPNAWEASPPGNYQLSVTAYQDTRICQQQTVNFIVDSIEDDPVVAATKTDALLVDVNGNGLVNIGDTVRYTVVISNAGGTAQAVQFADTLPSEVSLVPNSLTTTQGNILSATDILVNIGDLVGSATLTFDVVVNSATQDVISNQGTVTGANFAMVVTDDPDTPSLLDPTITPIQISSAITLGYSAPIMSINAPGGDVTFTLSITNTGERPVTLNSLLIDGVSVTTKASNTCLLPQQLTLGGFYSCTFVMPVTQTLNSTAVASGLDTVNATVSASDVVTINYVVIDTDGDGVVDGLDQCPNTLPNAQVDANGCEIVLDNDNDGVPNSVDVCPNTPPGVSVDETGCEVTVGTGDIQFTLSWDNTDDMDLWVVEPNGTTIAWFSRGPTVTGGQLDVDGYPACFSPFVAVENIFWPTGQAPTGTYTIRVDEYDGSCEPSVSNWTLTISIDGVIVEQYTGQGGGTLGFTIFTYEFGTGLQVLSLPETPTVPPVKPTQ